MQCGSCAEKKKLQRQFFLSSRKLFCSLFFFFFGNQSDLRLDLPIIFIHYI